VWIFLQVWLVGEKIGEGTGRTRKEAQHQACEISLKNLASEFFFLRESHNYIVIWYLRNYLIDPKYRIDSEEFFFSPDSIRLTLPFNVLCYFTADKYISGTLSDPEKNKEHGHVKGTNVSGYNNITDMKEDSALPTTGTSDESHYLDPRNANSKRTLNSIVSLRKLVRSVSANLISI
jgi:hypothetical protein